MILEEETFKKFGYYPSDLKPKSNKKILAACDDCGKIRKIRKYAYRALCNPCSTRGEKHHNWKGGKVERECEECGKLFFTKPSRVKIGKGKYCSFSCAGKANRRKQKFSKHRTKPELIFETICKNNRLPFHAVGDGQLWIGKNGEKQLNPDFIEDNGKRICIEIFGDYWHSPLFNRNMPEHGTLDYRKVHYKHYNWKPVFIWETDLLREDAEAFVLNLLEKAKVI